MGPGETLAALCLFGIVPFTAIWTSHRRKVLEIQLRLKQEGDVGLRASVDALREEMRQLKDTTMQYDISFDSALERTEQRLEGLERRVNEISSNQTASSQTVSIGRGD